MPVSAVVGAGGPSGRSPSELSFSRSFDHDVPMGTVQTALGLTSHPTTNTTAHHSIRLSMPPPFASHWPMPPVV